MSTISAHRCGRLAAAAIVCALTGCGAAVTRAAQGKFTPPPPLALVAIVDPTPGEAAGELRQLAGVIQAGATPSQALVVSLLAAAPASRTRAVVAGDSLSSIASAEGVPLAALQSANPQLGPLANRDWNRVYPGDRVTIPALDGATPTRNAIVTRAPAGPPAPSLVAPPARPANATTFQNAQYQRAVEAASKTNDERIAAWRAAVARDVAPWQAQVRGQLDELDKTLQTSGPAEAADGPAVTAAVQAAANTLAGLPGRRVLLLLAGGRLDETAARARALTPPPPPAAASLARIHLVIANVPAGAGASFTAAAGAAGANVTVLDPALTELQLPAAVNG
jgi:LysM repeat protein